MAEFEVREKETGWTLLGKKHLIQAAIAGGVFLLCLLIAQQALSKMEALQKRWKSERYIEALNEFLAPVLYYKISSFSGELNQERAVLLKFQSLASEELADYEAVHLASEFSEGQLYFNEIKKTWEQVSRSPEEATSPRNLAAEKELVDLLFLTRESVMEASVSEERALIDLSRKQLFLHEVQKQLFRLGELVANKERSEADSASSAELRAEFAALQRALQSLSTVKLSGDSVEIKRVNAALSSFEIAIDPLISSISAAARSQRVEGGENSLLEIRAALEASFTLGQVLSSSIMAEAEAVRRWTLLKVLLIALPALFLIVVGLWVMRSTSSELLSKIKLCAEVLKEWQRGNYARELPKKGQDEVAELFVLANTLAEIQQKNQTRFQELIHAFEELSKGNFSYRIEKRGLDGEYGNTVETFNHLAASFEGLLEQLHELGINLKASAAEIASNSKLQEGHIIEQESTTRQISVTASQISTTSKEFASTISEISTLAEKTSSLASEGQTGLTNMEKIMRQMVDASSNIASKLGVLNEKAGNITGVITTIAKVSEQTNLLSLNAAIEAEKAGQFGRSFSVIAREIKRLADQTALALLDIEKMVNEINSAVSSSVMGIDDFTQVIRNGVQQVERVGEQLVTIIDQVQTLAKRFDKVNHGMKSQSIAAEQINEALVELSNTASSTSESMRQFREAVDRLESNASNLKLAILNLKRDEKEPSLARI